MKIITIINIHNRGMSIIEDIRRDIWSEEYLKYTIEKIDNIKSLQKFENVIQRVFNKKKAQLKFGVNCLFEKDETFGVVLKDGVEFILHCFREDPLDHLDERSYLRYCCTIIDSNLNQSDYFDVEWRHKAISLMVYSTKLKTSVGNSVYSIEYFNMSPTQVFDVQQIFANPRSHS